MAGLDGQDGTGRREVVLAHDIGRSTKVGADTDTLEDGGGGEKHLGVGDAEAVNALSDWLGTSGLEGAGQESHMSFLIRGNDLDVVVNIGGETGLGEIVRGEVCKAFTVELVLKVLEGQGVV